MRIKAFFILSVFSIYSALGQSDKSNVDAPLGLRIKRNGRDHLIYADQSLSPNFNDYRKINYQVYFRTIDHPIKEINGRKYQLISIPGSSAKLDQKLRGIEKLSDGTITYPRAGKTIDANDYDLNFWIDVDAIENDAETEHYKYANDVFSGLLTAPFKYRLKRDEVPEALIDGDFNVAPFLGWKWRLSAIRPYYIAPFGFTGITTLAYNSANNSEISDPKIIENGVGLTYGAGLSFRFGDISPGFIIGWDKGFGNLGNGFLYNDKSWISFSINYDFFKPSKTSESPQK